MAVLLGKRQLPWHGHPEDGVTVAHKAEAPPLCCSVATLGVGIAANKSRTFKSFLLGTSLLNVFQPGDQSDN